MQLTNPGAVTDNLEFCVLGLSPLWLGADLPIIILRPLQQKQVELILHPPAYPHVTAGVYPFLLRIASVVQKILVEKGYTVDLLAEFDDRLEGYQATALLSIHADSCEYINELATGFKVAPALANKRPDKSERLTNCLAGRYARITGLNMHSSSITVDMTSYHAFGEIHDSTPAAILETGFLNLDRQFLTEEPQLAAQASLLASPAF